MTPDQALVLVRDALLTVVLLAAPLLCAGITVGLLAGVFQAVTSIQDSTLGASLKLFAIAATATALAPWLLRVAYRYTLHTLQQIAHLAPGVAGP
ncbi:MAG: EscS/YscS/HrcS family type III secretion system export apparatus protein [Planctomycetota bacterium]|nr:MAG: EscS/YscS/HrcS family type III secretion system export apparatus protein [Planctomycetota bacterium]